MEEDHDKIIEEIIADIDKYVELGNQGLARLREIEPIKMRAQMAMSRYADRDSILGRKYEKFTYIAVWHSLSRDGFALPSHIAEIKSYRTFLVELLGKDEVVPISQVTIGAGEVYTGRKLIRTILNKARTSIDVQDNYPGVELTSILEPYAEQKLTIRILTHLDMSNAVKSDLILFQEQYKNIKVRTNESNHGRFVMLDGNLIYHFGQSLKDLGSKMDALSELTDPKAKQKALEEFEATWESSDIIAP